ncbi:TPA: hypothetical protein SCR74_000266 [Citrobacter freundii]|uniref:hypothetical protein n=1 Tax=Citrobacter freundii TaxID=546 RepID=UPI001BCD665D|nr:hypothetical protein [Citrobacter freundii]HBU6170479.1 hypothetical protein [Citrobacter freundii]HBV8022537.1 hypothetical protein [Citrobacter freundii]HEG1869423.1 hypothetical protein [Citrobacter freundii]
MIINTNQPRQTRIGMTRQEREERAAAAARHRQLDELRARVRASMAGGDETPADPDTYRKAGLQAAKTWEAIERRAPTGKRQKIKGRIESGCGGNKHAGRDVTPLRGLPVQPRKEAGVRSVADVLRTITTIERNGTRLTVVYNDGERETLDDARDFLIEIISKELRHVILPHELNAAAAHNAVSGSQLASYGI